MKTAPHLLICIANDGTEDLQVLKIYRHLPDAAAESKGFVRVIDDSGEDYLYPKSFFLRLPLPPALERQLEDLALAQARPRDGPGRSQADPELR